MSLERYYGYLKSKRDREAASLAQEAARLFAAGKSSEGIEKSQEVLEIGQASNAEQALGSRHIEERKQAGLTDLTVSEFIEMTLSDPRDVVDIRPLFENPDFVKRLIAQVPPRLLQDSLPETQVVTKPRVEELPTGVAEKLPKVRAYAPEAKFILPDGEEVMGMVAKVLEGLDPFSPEPKRISREDLTVQVYGAYTQEDTKKLAAIVSKARPVLADWGRDIDCIDYSRGHRDVAQRGDFVVVDIWAKRLRGALGVDFRLAESIWVNGQEVALTPEERAIFIVLLRGMGNWFSGQEIAGRLVGKFASFAYNFDYFIRSLREKVNAGGTELIGRRGKTSGTRYGIPIEATDGEKGTDQVDQVEEIKELQTLPAAPAEVQVDTREVLPKFAPVSVESARLVEEEVRRMRETIARGVQKEREVEGRYPGARDKIRDYIHRLEKVPAIVNPKTFQSYFRGITRSDTLLAVEAGFVEPVKGPDHHPHYDWLEMVMLLYYRYSKDESIERSHIAELRQIAREELEEWEKPQTDTK